LSCITVVALLALTARLVQLSQNYCETSGYPLFLAALASLRFAIVVQAILEAGTVLVVGVAAAAVAGTMAVIVAA